jgi:tRNA-specific 2-thiouridylase
MSVGSGERERVVVGMSGGVDSSAAAALLLQQGYAPIGITLKLWPQDCRDRAEDKCCGPQAVADARAVCDRLGIPFYLVNGAEEFRREVISYFAAEYKAGRTPNPCVLCNEKLKFGTLLAQARKLGAERVATGHYARVELDPATGRQLLKRGRDLRRDQSYFLFSLRQDQLARAVFPLGDRLKTETRELARERQLKTADKEESMEICFVPDNDYGRFLRESAWVAPRRGEIVDRAGRVLGYHEGVAFYTIGQRRGLGVASARPLYVVDLDPAANRVVVGDAADLDGVEFVVERCNWIAFAAPPPSFEATVKIRYNHPGTDAVVVAQPGGEARVRLRVPQRAVTPGQACVFYQDDRVVGGGWIARGAGRAAAAAARGEPAPGR